MLFRYFPTISNSIFTLSPFFNFIKLVSFKVCGMIVIPKLFEDNLETVNETPFIDIEPFSITNFLNFLSNEKITFHDRSIIIMLLTVEVVSTCP